jgi:hypothetical protein
MRVVTLTTPDPVFTSRLPGIGEGAIRELGDSLFGKSPTFTCGGELGEFADRASAQTRMLWSDRRASLSARKGVTKMRFDRRDIFEDVASTILATATVMGFTATHQYWDVWLIGDSRRWTAGLLTIIALAMFALVARHIGMTLLVVLGCAAACFAGFAFATASLTPLSLLAATVILAWALAVLRDLFEVPRRPLLTH